MHSEYTTRGSLGDDEVTGARGGETMTVKAMLPKAGRQIKVVLG
jgi:hypothetical protein